jgi:hypothetical protein
MRVELPDGQWAELREGRLSYEQAGPLHRMFIAAAANIVDIADLPILLVRAFVTAWDVLDDDGHAVPLETPEKAPYATITAIGVPAAKLWKAQASPKATKRTSPSTLRAVR